MRATFDPTQLRVWSAALGPDGAGITGAEWQEGAWAGPWSDGLAPADVWSPDEWRSWTELWVRVEHCAPAGVGRVADLVDR